KTDILKVLEGTMGCSQKITSLLGVYRNKTHYSTKKTFGATKSKAMQNYYNPLVYDTLWAIALSINGSIQKHGIEKVKNYRHRDNKTKPVLDSLYKNLLAVDFQGMSGHFYYDNVSGLRQFDSHIGLFDSNGELSDIGYFDKNVSKLFMTEPDTVVWKSKGGSAPLDEEIKQYERRCISKTVTIVLSVLAGIGILLALIYIIYAVVHRDHIMIKDGWPIMTFVILIGCIILDVYILIHIGDLQTGIHPEPLNGDLCKATTGLLIFGFTFLYGGMTVKLWGIYKFFSQNKKKVINEGWLVFIFFMLIVADVIVVALWFVIDPLYPMSIELDSTLDDDTSVRTITVMIGCESVYKTYFLIAILCYKAIVLLLGGFIVWPALFMSMKKGFSHFSGFAVSMFTSLLASIVSVVIS
ncbi:unnamed protein product, partial [Owenia fusiformis]